MDKQKIDQLLYLHALRPFISRPLSEIKSNEIWPLPYVIETPEGPKVGIVKGAKNNIQMISVPKIIQVPYSEPGSSCPPRTE